MSSGEAALAEPAQSALSKAEDKSGIRVARIALRSFRSYRTADVSLDEGITVVHGPVGAGKTNLLEALYFGCVGTSCRTHNDRELVRFGEDAARVSVTTSGGELCRTFEVGLERGGAKAFRVDGAHVDRLPSDGRPLLCVFMPDRLELVKGAAGGRRSHLDSLVGALWPGKRAARLRYGRALAQRNALLGRIRKRQAAPAALSGWNRELAQQGIEVMQARTTAVALLAPEFQRYGAELGIEGQCTLTYLPRSHASTVDDLETELAEAFERDLERGFTTHGPHRDDLRFDAGGRDLRRFGSQGQQRLALLSLLLAEREALGRVKGETPMLLLDDVMSELDHSRRGQLLDVLHTHGQTLITTADLSAVQALARPVAELEVDEGRIS